MLKFVDFLSKPCFLKWGFHFLLIFVTKFKSLPFSEQTQKNPTSLFSHLHEVGVLKTKFLLKIVRKEVKNMIQLLFMVLFVEGVVAFLLVVKIGPLRELVMKSIDQVKMGKGPATVKTIGGTMAVILLSSVMSIFKIQNKGAKLGTMSPMDQVLWRTHLLEASLMGFTLFLGFLIDRMHHYMRKLIDIRSKVGASKEELEKLERERNLLKDKEDKASKEITTLQNQVSKLTDEVKKLKQESEDKDKKVETAEAHVVALQKQAADLLLEYDRLLEDNQNLQTQGIRT